METSPDNKKSDMNQLRAMRVHFVPGHIAVNEAQAHELLGLNDGRSERARKKAFYEFCLQHNIKPLPGRVFSVRKLEAACAA